MNIICFSGGKDSTAMLLLMLEKGIKVDEILFCDTGIEFPEMYTHIKKIEEYIGIPIPILKAEHSYEYMMFEHKKKRGVHRGEKGYDWAGPRYRWCTRYLKEDVMKRYKKEKYKNKEFVEFIGIAADESKRAKRTNKNLKYPLIEWGITEEMALQYCYSKGFNWGGLYQKFDRVSCWACPLQPLKSLRILYKEFPELWEKLKEWDNKAKRSFKPNYSVKRLEERFSLENVIT